MELRQASPSSWEVRWAYAAIPVSAFFMTIYGVRDLVIALVNLRQRREAIAVVEDLKVF